MTSRAASGGAPTEQVRHACRLLGSLAVTDGPIGPRTTYRVGGSAAVVVTVRSAAQLPAVADAVAASELPVLVVGRGSNLLVAERGFAGIAVVVDGAGELGHIYVGGADLPSAAGAGETSGGDGRLEVGVVEAGAAVPLPALGRRSVEAGLGGLEWAVGVPGSVGGGARMNAGGHGSDMAHTLRMARIADLGPAGDGRARPVTAEALAYGYRRSSVRPDQVVVSVRFHLVLADVAEGRRTIREIVRWRREHQPGRSERRVRVHQPAWAAARQLCWLADRVRRPEGPASGKRHGLAQTRQLHPGRSRRVRR